MSSALKYRIWEIQKNRYYPQYGTDNDEDDWNRYDYMIAGTGAVIRTDDVTEDKDDAWRETLSRNASKEVIIEQSTGLYDKNCKEIYEGDIVQVGKRIAEVVYDINQLRWVLAGRDWWVPITALSPVEYEVLGNIHENIDILDSAPPAEVENEKD